MGLINPADVMPGPTNDEVRRLRDNIKRRGVTRPIEVTTDGRIVDGRQRKRICDELGIDCPMVTVDGTDEELIHRAVTANVGRQMTKVQRDALALVLYHDHGLTYEEVAELLGVARRTIGRAPAKSADAQNASPVVGPDVTPAETKRSARRSEVAKLQRQGVGVPEIARQLGVADTTVYRDLDAMTGADGGSGHSRRAEPKPQPVELLSLRTVKTVLRILATSSVVNVMAVDAMEAFVRGDHEWIEAARAPVQELQRYGERLSGALVDLAGAEQYSRTGELDDASPWI